MAVTFEILDVTPYAIRYTVTVSGSGLQSDSRNVEPDLVKGPLLREIQTNAFAFSESNRFAIVANPSDGRVGVGVALSGSGALDVAINNFDAEARLVDVLLMYRPNLPKWL